MSMQRYLAPIVSVVACTAIFTVAATARAGAPSPIPSQSAPLDLGSKTHGIGAAPVAQPAPPPKLDVRPAEVPMGSGPDTPGKTGLGNTDRGPVGGAATGPGTEPRTGAPVGAGTPAAAAGPR